MSGSDPRQSGGRAGRAEPEREDGRRPSVVLALLAVTSVVALAAAGWLFNERQQTAFRTAKTETARLALEDEARRLRDAVAQERGTREAATRAGQDAEARTAGETTARVAAERVAESLRAELARERTKYEEAAAGAQGQLTRMRQAAQAAELAARELAAKDRAAKEASEQSASEARAQATREQAAAEDARRALHQALERATQERSAKEAAERALEEVREQLAKERSARRDAGPGAQQATVEQPKPAGAPPLRGGKSIAASDDLLALSDLVKTKPTSPESDHALRRLGELIPASDDRALLAALIERADRGPIAEGARQRLRSLQKAEETPVAPKPIRFANPGGWVTYRDPRLDFVFSYPAAIFSVEAGGAGERERIFVSPDGKARLLAHSGANAEGKSLAAYRTAMLEQRYGGTKLDYAPVRKSWFVLSGSREDEMFYERTTFTCNGKAVHGWKVVYPLAERAVYDRIVEEIHRSYKYDGVSRSCG